MRNLILGHIAILLTFFYTNYPLNQLHTLKTNSKLTQYTIINKSHSASFLRWKIGNNMILQNKHYTMYVKFQKWNEICHITNFCIRRTTLELIDVSLCQNTILFLLAWVVNWKRVYFIKGFMCLSCTQISHCTRIMPFIIQAAFVGCLLRQQNVIVFVFVLRLKINYTQCVTCW